MYIGTYGAFLYRFRILTSIDLTVIYLTLFIFYINIILLL